MNLVGRVRKTRAKAATAARYEHIAFWRSRPVEPNTVMYESFFGNGMLCNPEAIFRELLASPDMGHLRHIWVLRDLDEFASTVAEFAGDSRVSFVAYRSRAYFKALATSQYLVNNSTFPPEFAKRPGQTYVNTWHGTPLKKMGYEVPGGAGGPDARNIVRNFVNADYLLSANEFMTTGMYETSYRLRGVYRGAIIQEGYPRIDRQVLDDAGRTRELDRLRSRGVNIPQGHKVLLYAPTWRGDSFQEPTDDAALLLSRLRKLQASVDGDQWTILVKPHQSVARFAEKFPELRGSLVPNDIPSNLVLGVTDALVTDYSSIFYDFLATGRPVMFFIPDLHDYAGNRGLYVEPKDWPGPITDDISTVATWVNALFTGTSDDIVVSHADAYQACAATYAPLENGSASARVVDVVFRGATDGYDVRDDFTDARTSILLYLGGMRSNGITSSALNLLRNIDHEKYDVSVFYTHSRQRDRLKNEAAIDPRVRVFPRLGGMLATKVHHRARMHLLTHAVTGEIKPALRQAFREEWQRCFGDARFDYVVDFSGYGPFWDYLFLESPDAKARSVWLHNDMAADRMREVNGNRPFEQGLLSVFGTFHRFDHLVSVSAALSEVNERNLAPFVDDTNKFTFAPNTVDAERVRRMAFGLRGTATTTGGDALARVGDDLPDIVDRVAEVFGLEAIEDEVTRQRDIARIAPDAPGVTTFVTAGRLSTEKNHSRLIDAFAKVHHDHPATRLIIMGSGPLKRNLEAQIASLGLGGSILLAGQVANPFAIFARSDCFVLSSDHEGQPMVILEARILGLPIVTTDFSSVRGAISDDTGLIVPRSVDGVAEGMQAALDGKVPVQPFDADAYNSEAMQQFYRAIGAA
jgi:CDP-glycerol glycerophosphotransferase